VQRQPQVVETPHFRVTAGVAQYRFPGKPVDNELGDHIVAELRPLGLVPDAGAFERIFVETVLATAPAPMVAWSAFYDNTLRRLRGPKRGAVDAVSTFGRIYARAASLLKGTSVLDVGCCFGFLPMLLADFEPRLSVLGCDLDPATAALAAGVARARGNPAAFVAGDARRLPVRSGATDTVISLHVLEHLSPDAAGDVLAELCRVARRRVVVAVPLEDVPDPTYGHVRAFDLRALQTLGRATGWAWSVHEYEGGWLVLDRPQADGTISDGPPSSPPTCPVG
jgi:SAM-dependent methyltransferase